MRKLGIVFYLSILFSQHSIEKDLAYQMVLSHLEDKNLPEAYIKEAFTHDKIKIHPEIADRFARPYEKKTWEEYIKDPTDVYDKDINFRKHNRKDRFTFDLHGFSLNEAN